MLYLAICFIFLIILTNKKIVNFRPWRATVTPLASIIGSGFLIAAPVLNSLGADKAYLMMLALCAVSYAIGTVIRWNIHNVEEQYARYRSEKLSDIFLAFAYIFSITYYLYLLSSFLLKVTSLQNLFLEKGLCSLILCSIAYYGHQHGFKSLEKIEITSVNLKLSIIFTFLLALGYFNLSHDTPEPSSVVIDKKAIQILLGLVIMVQGFETSRYLGTTYKKETRIKSMRTAQIMSSAIYLLFILLFSAVFDMHPLSGVVKETSVIDSAKYVFSTAPLMLLLAALASQLSAALADMSGCGGLVSEFTRGKISEKNSYLVIAAFSLILIWSFNIFEVISLASKGFAIYYFFQCLSSMKFYKKRSKVRFLFSFLVSLVCLGVVIFGIAFE